MNRNITIGIIIAIIVAVGGFFGIRELNKYQDKKLDQAIITTIVRDRPALTANGKPVIENASIMKFNDGWYIAIIKSIHEKNMTVPVKVLLQNQSSSDKLKVIVGPDIRFSRGELSALKVPDSVITELLKP